jgi:hypothetical protein
MSGSRSAPSNPVANSKLEVGFPLRPQPSFVPMVTHTSRSPAREKLAQYAMERDGHRRPIFSLLPEYPRTADHTFPGEQFHAQS